MRQTEEEVKIMLTKISQDQQSAYEKKQTILQEEKEAIVEKEKA